MIADQSVLHLLAAAAIGFTAAWLLARWRYGQKVFNERKYAQEELDLTVWLHCSINRWVTECLR